MNLTRVKVRYLLGGFETEYAKKIAQALRKKGLVELVEPKQAKGKKKAGPETEPKSEE